MTPSWRGRSPPTRTHRPSFAATASCGICPSSTRPSASRRETSSGWRPSIACESGELLREAVREAEASQRHLAQARTSLTAVLEAIDARITVPRFDATIRDGLAGLGEVLLTAGRVLDYRSYLDRSRDLAQTLIDRYCEQDNRPTGFPGGGPNPSLFSGTAGIGYWLLRLDEPERVPCWLLRDPADVDEPTASTQANGCGRPAGRKRYEPGAITGSTASPRRRRAVWTARKAWSRSAQDRFCFRTPSRSRSNRVRSSANRQLARRLRRSGERRCCLL